MSLALIVIINKYYYSVEMVNMLLLLLYITCLPFPSCNTNNYYLIITIIARLIHG